MVIIGLNVLVWLMIVTSGGRGSKLIDKIALIPFGQCGSERSPGGYYPGVPTEGVCTQLVRNDGVWHPGVADGAYWQVLTSAFTHVEFWHIGFNMLALWVLGPQLELAIGRARFIALYLVSALAGSALVLWAAPTDTSTLGASGAVFGLMGALLVLAYKVRGNVQQILMWIGINAVLTLTISGISWQGHLGGFLGGLATGAVLVYAPRKNRTRLQVAGVSVIAIVVLAAIAARIITLA
jgi:membrane associated rhomboid family serine protease